MQLEWVRSQMGDVYRPVNAMVMQADFCAIYMERELGFEFNEVWGFEFVREDCLYTSTFLNWLYRAVLGYQITSPKCYLSITENNFQTCKIILVFLEFRVCFTVSSLDHFRTTRHLHE